MRRKLIKKAIKLSKEINNSSHKDIKISFKVHCIIKKRIVELTVKTGKTVTIKDYIEGLVLKDVSKKGKI